MTALTVQVQPALSPGLDMAEAVARLTRAGEHTGARVRVEEGFDRVAYVNLDFVAGAVAALWAAVQAELRAVPGLAEAAIACCQGEYGWDDYLLLHHYDPSEPLDQLP